MANLTSYTVSETYKDLLTVLGSTANQGLENTAKQVFDGEGTGSPLYLGTTTLDVVGTTTFTGDVTITGTLSPSKLIIKTESSLPSSPSTGEMFIHNGGLYIEI